MLTALFSRLTIILLGILYPAYCSFKAVRKRDHREYTKWMMYWIVFALFQTGETFTDIFISWLPLYYEVKIGVVVWLSLPIFEGSKQVYRRLMHPLLVKYEEHIDQGIGHLAQSGLAMFKKVSQAGLDKAMKTMVHSAIMGQAALNSSEQVVPGTGQVGDVRVQVGPNHSPLPPGDDHETLYSDTGNFELVGDEYTAGPSSSQHDEEWKRNFASSQQNEHFYEAEAPTHSKQF